MASFKQKLIPQFRVRIHTPREEIYESIADYEVEEHGFSFEWNIHECRHIVCMGYSRLECFDEEHTVSLIRLQRFRSIQYNIFQVLGNVILF
jgi:hypothetical protein